MSNFSTREVADLLGVKPWQIQRLFEDGDLPNVPRFAGKRVIVSTMIPQVVDALRNRDWLPETATTGEVVAHA